VFQSQTAESVATMISNDYIATGDIHFSQAYVDNIRCSPPSRSAMWPASTCVPNVSPPSPSFRGRSRDPARRAQAAAAPQRSARSTLDNGACLIRRDPTTPLVASRPSRWAPDVRERSDQRLSRLASLLLPRGTATRSARQIAEFFDSRGGSFDAASGNNAIYTLAEVLKADFAPRSKW